MKIGRRAGPFFGLHSLIFPQVSTEFIGSRKTINQLESERENLRFDSNLALLYVVETLDVWQRQLDEINFVQFLRHNWF